MGDMGRAGGFTLQDLIGLLSGGGGQAPRIEPWVNNRARDAGVKAVEGATTGRMEPTVSGETAHAAGLGAVDKEMDQAATEAWREKMAGRKADRARAGSEGKAAVADAVSPSRVRALIQSMSQLPGWTPEESAAWAQSLGQVGVEGALHQPQNPAGWSPPAMPMTPPGTTFGPHPVVTPDMAAQPGYAPPSQRAQHYGQGAVERELLDKEPE
jgi:hypothetical protein